MATTDIAFLVADTLLSPPFELKGHSGPINGRFHGLKVQLLNPRTAVAFATSNNAETSLKIINDLHAALTRDGSTHVCERLFHLYSRAIVDANGPAPDTEFLVLQLTAGGKQLARITKDGVHNCRRAYIGEPAAYKRMTALRRAYTSPKTQYVQQVDGTFRDEPLIESDGEIEFEQISQAVSRLASERGPTSVGAIGGCIVRVVDARISGELEYLQEVEVSRSREEGHSGFSVLASYSDAKGIAIYYRSGKIGFIFVVGDTEYCRKEYSETLSDFIKTAEVKYGLALSGGIWRD